MCDVSDISPEDYTGSLCCRSSDSKGIITCRARPLTAGSITEIQTNTKPKLCLTDIQWTFLQSDSLTVFRGLKVSAEMHNHS